MSPQTVTDMDVAEHREPAVSIHPLLYERWSPRAMTGEPLSEEALAKLFEAARWAPSSYNGQPWRFVYALRDTPEWETLFELLIDFNQQWASEAGALLVVVSRTTFEHNGEPAPTHSFDTGAAWQNLALQGRHMGLVVHAMEGFDRERSREALGVPDDHAVEAMVAIGHPGEVDDLPDELAEREEPSGRKPVEEIVRHGTFA